MCTLGITRRARGGTRISPAPRRSPNLRVAHGAASYGAPPPNVNGVHRPCTLGAFVKCLDFIGLDPGLPFSFANASQCRSHSSALKFFNPTVFEFPFAYVARTCGSLPRFTNVANAVSASSEDALVDALIVDERRRNSSNRPLRANSFAPFDDPVTSQ